MKTLRITFDEYPDDWIDTIISPVGVGTLLDIIAKSSRVSLTREAFGELYGLFAVRGRVELPRAGRPRRPVARDMNQMLAVIYALGRGGPQAPLLAAAVFRYNSRKTCRTESPGTRPGADARQHPADVSRLHPRQSAGRGRPELMTMRDLIDPDCGKADD